jgi:tight adherence protein C
MSGLLLLIGLAFLGASVVLVARGLAAPRARAAERLGQIEAYGFGAEPFPVPDTVPSDASRVAARIGDAVARRLGGVREADLRRELMAAGMYSTTPGALLGYRVVLAVLLGALMLIPTAAESGNRLPLVLLTVLAVTVGWLLPLVVVRSRARRRYDAIDRELPNLIDLLVVTVEAGLSFSGSLRVAAREFTGPLGDELRLTLQEESMGLGVNEALGNLLTRADTPAVRSFVRGVIQGESLGVAMGSIMRNLAVDMRKRRRSAAEERAHKAPIKILFPLVFLVFPVIFIVLLMPAVLELTDAFT